MRSWLDVQAVGGVGRGYQALMSHYDDAKLLLYSAQASFYLSKRCTVQLTLAKFTLAFLINLSLRVV